MKQLKVVIIEPVGLHARPATLAVSAASKYKSSVNLKYGDHEINMKSIMGVMSLGVPTQAEIVITCEGEDEAEAVAGIEEALRTHKIIA